jgi:cytochrome c553
MPAHIVRLLLLLTLFLILAVTARYYVLDPSYYQFGDYRGDAVVEMAAYPTPQFRGTAYCQACHPGRHTEWTSGAHWNVKCEVCHGAAREHPATGPMPKPEDTVKLCTVCHEAMPGRPVTHPQVVVAEHPVPHDGPIQCLTCHNPHSPRPGAQPEPPPEQVTVVPAEAPAPPPMSEHLVALTTPCTPCHGADGRSAAMSAALAGAEQSVLARKLEDYRSGAIEHAVMNAVTRSLSDEDIADLAEHYASLPGGPTQ